MHSRKCSRLWSSEARVESCASGPSQSLTISSEDAKRDDVIGADYLTQATDAGLKASSEGKKRTVEDVRKD